MPGFIESNITLNFSDSNFFRFEACDGYRSLSGHSFKEMDACWLDLATNTYWLFELKDFTAASLGSSQNIEQRTQNIFKKCVDSLCMFLSSVNGYPYARYLNSCFPLPPPNALTEFKFITVVHCNPGQESDVQLIHNSFRNKFRPYAELFNVSHYAVLEHSSAIRNLQNNMVQ